MMTIDTALALLFWITGFVLLWKIPLCRKDEKLDKDDVAVSVIIPARNEEGNLPTILNSFKTQTLKPLEIIVVDDGSTDNTAGVAKEYGADVVQITDKPEGWNGKSWACWTGAEHASGDVLMFLDADTQLEPERMEGLLSAYKQKEGALSVQPFHVTKQFYEKLSAFLNIMVMAGMNAFSIFGDKLKPAGAFGPCIVISRDNYFKTGGHEAVKSALLEDIPLGKNFMDQGLYLQCASGKGSINFRMYPDGIKSQIEGWSKSFALGASDTKPVIMFLTILWISGCFMAFTGALPWRGEGCEPMTGMMVYGLYAVQINFLLKRIGNFGWLTAILFPLPLIFFTGVYFHSFLGTFIFKTIKWKGRKVYQ